LISQHLLFRLASLFELFHHLTLRCHAKMCRIRVMHLQSRFRFPLKPFRTSLGHPPPLLLLLPLQQMLMSLTDALNLWARLLPMAEENSSRAPPPP
jgi:hypothetical protein